VISSDSFELNIDFLRLSSLNSSIKVTGFSGLTPVNVSS
jgi:hypothetical protein